jgi:aspartate kinase
MIVMKFGGSSVDCAASIERVVEIVRWHLPRRPVVVVSAMAKTTRRLLEGAEAAAAGDRDRAHSIFDELRDFHRRESHGVVPEPGRERLDRALDGYFGELRQLLNELAATRALTPRAADAAASTGELLASEILAAALAHRGVASQWIDCRRVMVTDAEFTRARPLYGPTDARLRGAVPPVVERGAVPVIGGYVGATADGITTTLGKEGSDFSAAVIGAALGAEEIQIWTDVEGLLTADPRVVPGARRLRSLSFAEALELACSGAKKPHPGTLGPASRSGVPIRILSSLQGGEPGEGTLIGPRAPQGPPRIRSITCRGNAHRLRVSANGPWARNGFLSWVLDACERFRPSLLVLDVADGEVELALDRSERLNEIRSDLGKTSQVEVSPGTGIVSLVSQDLGTHPELVGRVLEAAREYEPRLVTQGAACPVVRCLVDEERLDETVAVLHERLFADEPDGVIG